MFNPEFVSWLEGIKDMIFVLDHEGFWFIDDDMQELNFNRIKLMEILIEKGHCKEAMELISEMKNFVEQINRKRAAEYPEFWEF